MNVYSRFPVVCVAAFSALLCLSASGQTAGAQAAASAAAVIITMPVFVLNSLDDCASVMNPASWTEIKRIATGKSPSHLWIDSNSRPIYSTMQESDELIAIDLATQTVKWRTPTGSTPADLIGTANEKFVRAALTGGNGVDVYNVSGKEPRRVKFIKTAMGSHASLAFGDKRHLLVSNGRPTPST